MKIWSGNRDLIRKMPWEKVFSPELPKVDKEKKIIIFANTMRVQIKGEAKFENLIEKYIKNEFEAFSDKT